MLILRTCADINIFQIFLNSERSNILQHLDADYLKVYMKKPLDSPYHIAQIMAENYP